VTTKRVAQRLGIEEEWLVSRTGIRSHRVLAPEASVSDLACDAARAALADAGVAPEDIDLIVAATTTADGQRECVSLGVAAALGSSRAATIDVGAACTGFISALALAGAWLEAGRATCALVIGADAMTRITNRDDRRTAALFGDGAGAVVVEPAVAGGLGPVILRCDGAGAPALLATRARRTIEMDGQETYRNAVARLTDVSREAVVAASLDLGDIDLFVFHQANARITRAVGERLRIAPARVVDCIEHQGNTGAATLALALDQARRAGQLKRGMRVLLAAFGAGFTWGGAVVEW
jgi:3-oxoacyl-[acyl-carrier-protein] synthase-3